MRFILGVLLGYYMRAKKRLLISTLTVLTVLTLICSVVLPAIALYMLGLSVMRERASRSPQTSVPMLIGLNYKTAQIKVRDANLKRAASCVSPSRRGPRASGTATSKTA